MSRLMIGSLLRLALVVPVVCVCLGLGGPVDATGSFDGVYKGTQKTIRTNNTAECSTIDQASTTLTIKDNHLTRLWAVVLDVDVAADGTFYASEQPSTGPLRVTEIKGQIIGGNLEADVGSRYCAGHLSLKKS